MIRLVLLVLLCCLSPANAVAHLEPVDKKYYRAEGVMKNVGQMLYGPLNVLGGSCVLIAPDWVLTSRHGTARWDVKTLKVKLPELTGRKGLEIKRIIFPPSGDIALLELKRPVRKGETLPLVDRGIREGDELLIGGFGRSGQIGDLVMPGTFCWGRNVVSKIVKKQIRLHLRKGRVEGRAVLTTMDSGSPAFVKTDAGWQLCGIGSSASNGWNPKEGDRCNYVQTFFINEWLAEQMK